MEIPSPADIAKRASHDLYEAKQQLDALLEKVDGRYLFTADARGRLYATNPDSTSKYFRPAAVAIELNAWVLYPYFDKGTDRNPALIQQSIDALEAYQKSYAIAEMFSGTEIGLDAQGNNSLMTHLRLHSANVRGSAYPIQVEQRIRGVLAPFENHFRSGYGIGAIRALDIAKAILFQMEDNLNSDRKVLEELMLQGVEHFNQGNEGKMALESLSEQFHQRMEGLGDQWVPTFDQIAQRINGLSWDEWNALSKCVGMTPTSRNLLSTPIEVQDHPIYFVRSDQAFAGQGTAVLDAIFHFFDSHARGTAELVNQYGDRVSEWMESEIARYLKRIFPAECVIENACYPNPDIEGHEAETDAVVVWGPILIVVEAKGRKVDQAGFRGVNRKLKNAIAGNIQDAFFQADRVIRALNNSATLIFKEKHSGRKVSVSHGNLRRVMPISVTLEHLMGIPTRLAITQRLGLFKGGAYPWSVSIDDLDVITRFAGSPDVFLHYIERRIAHQSCDIELNADELDVFGHYLDNRLHPSLYENRPEILEHGGTKAIAINGGEERFDPFYTAEWYGTVPPQDVPDLKVPAEVKRVLKELRCRDDDGAKFIAFALLGLSDEILTRIDRNLFSLRNGGNPTRQIYRTTFSENQVVVNLMAHATMGEKEFFQNVTIRSRLEHYRARAKATVTIGINLTEDRAFQTAQWLEGDWEYEPEIEELLMADRASNRSYIQPTGSPKLGRNSLCPCGSNKKFKKCCWGKIGVTRKRSVPASFDGKD